MNLAILRFLFARILRAIQELNVSSAQAYTVQKPDLWRDNA